MLETLEKLFGSAAKVKIMRLFLFNPSQAFDMEMVARRSKVSSAAARSEVSMMEKIGLIKKRSFYKERIVGRGKIKKTIRRRATGFAVDETFEYLQALEALLIQASIFQNREIINKLSRAGKLKLVIASGFFVQNLDAGIDLLIVGEGIKKGKLEAIVSTIESEIGREIRYAAFEVPDFKYRLGMYDKLIRDILDYKHEKILDKLGMGEK